MSPPDTKNGQNLTAAFGRVQPDISRVCTHEDHSVHSVLNFNGVDVGRRACRARRAAGQHHAAHLGIGRARYHQRGGGVPAPDWQRAARAGWGDCLPRACRHLAMACEPIAAGWRTRSGCSHDCWLPGWLFCPTLRARVQTTLLKQAGSRRRVIIVAPLLSGGACAWVAVVFG